VGWVSLEQKGANSQTEVYPGMGLRSRSGGIVPQDQFPSDIRNG